MTATSFDLNSTRVQRLFEQAGVRAQDVRPAWRRAQQYMRVRTDTTFERLRRGGTFRGVRWPYFSESYIGQKRPSGAIVKRGDAVLQDTGTLRSRAALTQLLDRNKMRLGTNLNYAAKQAKRRPFLFFQIPQDVKAITRIVLDHLLAGKGR